MIRTARMSHSITAESPLASETAMDTGEGEAGAGSCLGAAWNAG
jgi:hypothetical protein